MAVIGIAISLWANLIPFSDILYQPGYFTNLFLLIIQTDNKGVELIVLNYMNGVGMILPVECSDIILIREDPVGQNLFIS